jgi:hypothetical protein
MAEKLPVIIDNRGENRVLQALQRLFPNLQRMNVATGVFEHNSPCMTSLLRTYCNVVHESICIVLTCGELPLRRNCRIAEGLWR